MSRTALIAYQRRNGGLLPDDDEEEDDAAWEPPYLSRGYLPRTPDDERWERRCDNAA